MYKSVKLSFEEQDALLTPHQSEKDVIVITMSEIDNSSHFALYLTKQEVRDFTKELLKFIEE